MTRSTFPVLLDYRQRETLVPLGCPTSVPWWLVAPHEPRAQRNHEQSLERLAQRGGLGPSELVSLLLDQDLNFERTDREALPKLLEILSQEIEGS